MKVFLLLSLLGLASASSMCVYDDILGTWTVSEGDRLGDHYISCFSVDNVVYTKEFTYSFPNTVTDELGNKGTWTLIGFTGFETNINGRSYFAYFAWDDQGMYCDRTLTGFARDVTVRNWACYEAQKTTKVAQRVTPKIHTPIPDRKWVNNHELINQINSMQSSWKAKAYPQHEQYSLDDMFKRAGGHGGRLQKLPPAAPVTEEHKAKSVYLPDSFDWRDVNSVNYVSPVRDQMQCGSCYAFSSMASIEARLRIATKNQRQDIFSPQDVIECTSYGSGCNGGWPYLIGGRYADEQGVVPEACNPYKGRDGRCTTDQSCARTYVSEYEYVGGFYGGCNEELMMQTLVTEGPFPVLYMVYNDFYNYVGGVYSHTQTRDKFNPYEPSNHAVTLVGYGTEESTGEKYWTIKNSWGDWWGENGYFRILRGTDECSIESAGFNPSPIP